MLPASYLSTGTTKYKWKKPQGWRVAMRSWDINLRLNLINDIYIFLSIQKKDLIFQLPNNLQKRLFSHSKK